MMRKNPVMATTRAIVMTAYLLTRWRKDPFMTCSNAGSCFSGRNVDYDCVLLSGVQKVFPVWIIGLCPRDDAGRSFWQMP